MAANANLHKAKDDSMHILGMVIQDIIQQI